MKKGFTLVEVLITLTIIGIVAVLTLPNIVQNYKKSVAETRLIKFYTSVRQAQELSILENGNPKFWEYPEDAQGIQEWYNKYFDKYLSTTRVIPRDLVDTEGNILPNRGIFTFFSDGSVAVWTKNNNSTIIYIFYYINPKIITTDAINNSNYKKLHKPGVNYFVFLLDQTASKGTELIHTYGTPETNLEVLMNANNRTDSCSQAAAQKNEPAMCARVIELNGWKIPSNYPFKF